MVCARTKALFCKGLLLLGNRLMQLPHSHQVTSPLCRALSLTYAQEQILITFLFLLLSHTIKGAESKTHYPRVPQVQISR